MLQKETMARDFHLKAPKKSREKRKRRRNPRIKRMVIKD